MTSKRILSIATAILFLTTPITATAIQKRQTLTVIPGPGLPSLVSLNLTSSALYAMNRTVLPDGINYSQECGPGDEPGAAISDVTACFNYLVVIGSEECSSGRLCTAGTAAITSGGDLSETECINIAVVVQEIIVRCGTGTGDGSTEDGGENGTGVSVRNAIYG